MLVAATAVALLAATGACRRADEGGPSNTMNPASSEVMGNTAGVTGTPGQSDAAQRADHAPASAPATASPPPVATTPPVASTPGTSGSSSGAAGAGD
jgi:hypothetical protein